MQQKSATHIVEDAVEAGRLLLERLRLLLHG